MLKRKQKKQDANGVQVEKIFSIAERNNEKIEIENMNMTMNVMIESCSVDALQEINK